MKTASLVLALAPILILTEPSPSRACGGFFCNAQTPVPIVQAGERILFAAHDGLVTMHIEITYQGDPTSFGWILPMPEAPMDTMGVPLPLDKVVEVSSQLLFPSLQAATDPQFVFTRDPHDTTSCPFTGTDVTSVQDTGTSFQDANTPDPTPPVVVLQSAAIGPYDAELIEASRSDALYAWLGEHGYIQDPKAQPILDHYVSKRFKFLGIKLRSGRDTRDLRPLAITLSEGAPCVPLVLTQIAATPAMPILVWVLGPGRAVPKNFIHAVVDPRAISLPSGADYQQKVSEAIDAASGRAFVTELAGPAANFAYVVPPVPRPGWSEARTLLDVVQALGNDLDVSTLLRERVPMPAGLRGYPFGNCMQCPSCSWAETECERQGLPNAEHLTTEAEFYGFISYWAQLDAETELDLGVDVPALVAAAEREIVSPRRKLATLFTDAWTLTRFFTLLSPDEMTRDPIFAFNADLPGVSNVHRATWDLLDCDSGATRVRYAEGFDRVTTCSGCARGFASVSGAADAPALFYPEILDEEGAPVKFAVSQVPTVDGLLDAAQPGIPTLPPYFKATPPVIAQVVDDAVAPPEEGADSGGCAGADAPVGSAFVAALLLILRRKVRARHVISMK